MYDDSATFLGLADLKAHILDNAKILYPLEVLDPMPRLAFATKNEYLKNPVFSIMTTRTDDFETDRVTAFIVFDGPQLPPDMRSKKVVFMKSEDSDTLMEALEGLSKALEKRLYTYGDRVFHQPWQLLLRDAGDGTRVLRFT